MKKCPKCGNLQEVMFSTCIKCGISLPTHKGSETVIKLIGFFSLLTGLQCILGITTTFVNGDWARKTIYYLWFVSGTGLLFFRNWARLLSILAMGYLLITDTIFHLDSIVSVAFTIYFVLIILYLTRPTVKEQFR